jgi:hypothetical protein
MANARLSVVNASKISIIDAIGQRNTAKALAQQSAAAVATSARVASAARMTENVGVIRVVRANVPITFKCFSRSE